MDRADEAVLRCRSLPVPFELGRALLIAGQVIRRAHGKRRAREAFVESLELFDRLGAPLWAERTRQELARVGGRPASPAALTATESQVAELVAAGLSNQQVAATLFISLSTVEANLTRIYRKLGVRPEPSCNPPSGGWGRTAKPRGSPDSRRGPIFYPPIGNR